MNAHEGTPRIGAHTLGFVRRDARTPKSIISTCEDWFDGQNSAMCRFYEGELVDPRMLGSEASLAIVKDAPREEKELRRLRELEAWCIRRNEIAMAMREIAKARSYFNQAISDAGIDAKEAEALLAALARATGAPQP